MSDYKITAFDLKLGLLQYCRFRRQWVCVDECNNADIIADTGKEIIEIEVKITKSDLIYGEGKKRGKHNRYMYGGRHVPNKFMFCVPENMVETATNFSQTINDNYGVIGFDSVKFLQILTLRGIVWRGNYIRIARSAKKLHNNYDKAIRWSMAKRMSSKITIMMKENFRQQNEQLRKLI